MKDSQTLSYQAKRTAAITEEIAQLCGIPQRNEVTVMRFLSSKNVHGAVTLTAQKAQSWAILLHNTLTASDVTQN